MTKKILALFVVLSIFITLAFPVKAEEDGLSAADKAEILNQFSIIKGDGIDYNLDGVLKRNEASVFIIRLMGQEDEVLSNKAKYKSTKFPDVGADAWYAPYVGFCVQKSIVSGYLDGKFHPDDFISEKAFLKLVLGALGYTDGTDFTWDNLYNSAYKLGLVTDSAYEKKTVDNIHYTRGEVVEVLYNALMLKKKNSKVTVIQSLVADGIISKDIAISLGVIKDETETSIQDITVRDEANLLIKLNEEVEAIDAKNIQIYESDNKSNKLTASIESQTGGDIKIKTSSQKPEKSYTVEISNVTDLESNTMDTLTGSFIGYKSEEIKSDFFKISKVEPINNKALKLYFTHPVNANSEIASYYEIFEGEGSFVEGSSQTMVVKALGTCNNGVILYLKDQAFSDAVSYTLKVSGDLNSAYGVKLAEGAGDSAAFIGKGSEDEELKVTDTSLVDYKILQIKFNKEINPSLAQQIYNFYITDASGNALQIKKAVLGGDGDEKGKDLLLSIASAFDKNKDYELTINNLNDITRQYYITESKYQFSGLYPDKINLVIDFAVAEDKGTILVYFNRPLDSTAAAVKEYYAISGVTDSGFLAIPAKAYYDPAADPRAVKLYLPADKVLSGSKSYKIKVLSGIQDYLGSSPSKSSEFTFTGSSEDNTKPTISNATIISKDTIKVKLSKEIALDIPNIIPTNYTLEYKEDRTSISKIPISVIYADATTLIIKFDSLDYAISYTLKFSSLKDYAGNIRTKTDGENLVTVALGK